MSGNEHVVSGLLRKRAEIAGALEDAYEVVRGHTVALEAVDATIRLFAPELDATLVAPKRARPRAAAARGEIARVVLNALRESRQSMTCEEITGRVMAARGLDAQDVALYRTMITRVRAGLRYYQLKGLLQSAMGPGKRVLWKTVS